MNYHAQGGLTVEFSVIKMSNVFWNIYISDIKDKDEHLITANPVHCSLEKFFSLRGHGSRFAGVDFSRKTLDLQFETFEKTTKR